MFLQGRTNGRTETTMEVRRWNEDEEDLERRRVSFVLLSESRDERFRA